MFTSYFLRPQMRRVNVKTLTHEYPLLGDLNFQLLRGRIDYVNTTLLGNCHIRCIAQGLVKELPSASLDPLSLLS